MNNQFWDNLLSIALSIEEIFEENGEDALAELSTYLETIDISYRRTFDPVDAYQEYVALTLCRVVGKALDWQRINDEPSRG